MAPAAIDQFVLELTRHFKDNMTIEVSRPLGTPALLSISLARTLKAYVILRGEGAFETCFVCLIDLCMKVDNSKNYNKCKD